MRIKDDLIECCKRGERSSQKNLYVILLPYLNTICQRYAYNPSNIQDILQESFIRIFKNIETYDTSRAKFKTWVTKITINCCLKNNQKVKRKTDVEKNVELEKDLDRIELNITLEPDILVKLNDDDFQRFINKMPAEYLQIFNLYIMEEFNHVEIANLLSINENLSRKRLSRARNWLKSKTNLLYIEEHFLGKIN
jgi:RNA polymerase sigma-70 factor (ECF subfamily)